MWLSYGEDLIYHLTSLKDTIKRYKASVKWYLVKIFSYLRHKIDSTCLQFIIWALTAESLPGMPFPFTTNAEQDVLNNKSCLKMTAGTCNIYLVIFVLDLRLREVICIGYTTRPQQQQPPTPLHIVNIIDLFKVI